MLTTKQVAEKLNITPTRVRQLCNEGKIKAQRIGRDWIIEEKNIKNITLPGPGNWRKKNGSDIG